VDPDGRDVEGFLTKLNNLHNLRVLADRILRGAFESGSPFVLSEEMIKGLHRTCMSGLLDEAGEYRQVPVKLHKSAYVPPHHSEVPVHMQQFCKLVNDEWKARSPTYLSAMCLWRLSTFPPYAFTSGQPPSLSGRNASSIGVVASSVATSHSCLLSAGVFASNR
jgi:hypothetical protein